MSDLKLKTNVKCSVCVSKITPFLDEAVGKEAWQVDTNDPNKILTIKDATKAAAVKDALQKAGYKGEEV